MKTIRRHKRLTENSIYRFLNRSRKEIKKCEKAGAYLAAIVLIGANLEYLLTAWIRAYPGVAHDNHRKSTANWNLKELIHLAWKSGFLDHKSYLSAERIRKYRNLVHPNWYAGRRPLRFTKRVLEDRLADYDAIMNSFRRNV